MTKTDRKKTTTPPAAEPVMLTLSADQPLQVTRAVVGEYTFTRNAKTKVQAAHAADVLAARDNYGRRYVQS